MAKGRKPHPAGYAKKLGNPGKRRIHETPADIPGIGSASPDLVEDEATIRIWNSIVPELDNLGLRKHEKGALVRYCAMLYEWGVVRLQILEQGRTYENPVFDKDGERVGKLVKMNPLHRIRMDYERMLLKYEQELCITPLTRQSLLNATFGAGKGADPEGKGKASTDQPFGDLGLDDSPFGFGKTKPNTTH